MRHDLCPSKAESAINRKAHGRSLCDAFARLHEIPVVAPRAFRPGRLGEVRLTTAARTRRGFGWWKNGKPKSAQWSGVCYFRKKSFLDSKPAGTRRNQRDRLGGPDHNPASRKWKMGGLEGVLVVVSQPTEQTQTSSRRQRNPGVLDPKRTPEKL